MEKITSVIELKEAIRLLEIKQAREKELLKKQFEITLESLKPANLIKSQLNELKMMPAFKENFWETTLGVTGGLLLKRMATGPTGNPLKKMLRALFNVIVKNVVPKHADGSKTNVVNEKNMPA
jgi:hypothetical protein